MFFLLKFNFFACLFTSELKSNAPVSAGVNIDASEDSGVWKGRKTHFLQKNCKNLFIFTFFKYNLIHYLKISMICVRKFAKLTA